MIHLSRLILNPRGIGVARDINDPYELHRTVMHAFDGHPGGNRVLFRLDQPRHGSPVLYVQSTVAPDWDYLHERHRYLAGDPDGRGNPAVRAWEPEFRHAQTLRFRLRANPVKRDNATRKRLALFQPDEQLAWLDRKAGRHGFQPLPGTLLRDEGMHSFGRRRKIQEGGKLFAVRFDGLLRVTDPARFAETVRDGIGPAKGLGFGLLSLAPARG